MQIPITPYLLSQTILLPGLVGLFRWSKIDAGFRPFVIICLTISLNETVRFILINTGRYDLTSYNIFLIITALLYVWMFERWGLFRNHPQRLYVIIGLLALFWIGEHFMVNGYQLHIRTPYIRMLFSMLQVFMAVSVVNGLIVSEKRSLLTNSRFLICAAIIIYYTYRILVDAFSLQGLSRPFLENMADFNRYLVQVMNLLFLIAAIWIPRKKSFILPS
jgi:hypothetical protein